MALRVVERFQLQERYRVRYLEDAIRRLQSATTVSVSREGVIMIRVEDTDPRRASDMANFHAEQLDRLVARYGVGEAGRQRGFLTEQIAQAKVGLDAAEEALRRFQEKNRAIVLQDQTRGAIEAAARLKGEIMAAQVQLQVVRNFATDANPEVVALKRRVDEMNRQLSQIL
jgi:capsule polysaccharide export protein KpsE/RkpR